MSEKNYMLEILYKDTGLEYKGLVNKSVIDKIKKRQFVEFNLLLGYDTSKFLDGEETAYYKRLYYSPVDEINVNFTEIPSEEQC